MKPFDWPGSLQTKAFSCICDSLYSRVTSDSMFVWWVQWIWTSISRCKCVNECTIAFKCFRNDPRKANVFYIDDYDPHLFFKSYLMGAWGLKYSQFKSRGLWKAYKFTKVQSWNQHLCAIENISMCRSEFLIFVMLNLFKFPDIALCWK